MANSSNAKMRMFYDDCQCDCCKIERELLAEKLANDANTRNRDKRPRTRTRRKAGRERKRR
jgi:hypothetical protein